MLNYFTSNLQDQNIYVKKLHSESTDYCIVLAWNCGCPMSPMGWSGISRVSHSSYMVEV